MLVALFLLFGRSGMKKKLIKRNKIISKIFAAGIFVSLLSPCIFISAKDNQQNLSGKVYECSKDENYLFSSREEYSETSKNNTYGKLSVDGNITLKSDKNGVPAYKIDEGNLNIIYSYDDDLLNAAEEEWHLYEDKSKKIDVLSLDTSILNGAVVVQTSKDMVNWVTVSTETNVFCDKPQNNDSIYSTTSVQLINGCYYRVIVAYETQRKIDPKQVLFLNFDNYEYLRHTEVYEFYAYTESTGATKPDPNQTYNIGSKVRTDKFDGYYGEKIMEKDDIHYGWDLGSFYISGYTSKKENEEKNPVFLKNVGDKVTLWFNLKQNIDALNNNTNLKISADDEGYDQYFETPKTDFGRGTLIVRYTDYNNNSTEPQIYTNYLEANTSVDADTQVQLFDEGDYEVALDYQITNDKLVDKISHYRIFFKFSVRNGDCMVFPFELGTQNELSNKSLTDNGFYLDFGKSRYLDVNIKREILKDSEDGLTEDIRFNGPAKDGAEYNKEGIYTIKAENKYTGLSTEKKIYVGKNKVLKAHINTGKEIAEINELVNLGAEIDDYGKIKMPVITEISTTMPIISETLDITEEITSVAISVSSSEESEMTSENTISEIDLIDNAKVNVIPICISGGIVAVGAVVATIIKKRK